MKTIYDVIVKTEVIQKSEESNAEALHILVPHCTNWRMTEACVAAFSALTERRHTITVVNNFDLIPDGLKLLKNPKVSVIDHQLNALGRLARLVYKKRHGSFENALALDAAIRERSMFTWAFMAHTDAAPLVRGWDRYYFDKLEGKHRIAGNFRDIIRVHAAHASGTLFHQETLVAKHVSLAPVYDHGEQKLDVGDQATVVLHDLNASPVPALPNTRDDKSLVSKLEAQSPELIKFVNHGSIVSFDAQEKLAIYMHLGRGTPRTLQDPQYANKVSPDIWIELLERTIMTNEG